MRGRRKRNLHRETKRRTGRQADRQTDRQTDIVGSCTTVHVLGRTTAEDKNVGFEGRNINIMSSNLQCVCDCVCVCVRHLLSLCSHMDLSTGVCNERTKEEY